MSFAASEARTCPIVYVDTANKEVLIWSTHHQAPKVRSQKVTECKKYFITVPENIKENGIFFSPLKAIAYTLIKILPFVSFRSTTLGLLEIMLCKTPLQSRCSIFFFFLIYTSGLTVFWSPCKLKVIQPEYIKIQTTKTVKSVYF